MDYMYYPINSEAHDGQLIYRGMGSTEIYFNKTEQAWVAMFYGLKENRIIGISRYV